MSEGSFHEFNMDSEDDLFNSISAAYSSIVRPNDSLTVVFCMQKLV